jgi:predicted nucleic acid-binding protein
MSPRRIRESAAETSYVDTNVIVRYLVGDDPVRARAAAIVIDSDRPLSLSIVSVLEAAHVLRVSYGRGRQEIARALVDLLARENITVPEVPTKTVMFVLVRWRDGEIDSVGDALIAASMLASAAGEVYSFDATFPAIGWRVIEPGAL